MGVKLSEELQHALKELKDANDQRLDEIQKSVTQTADGIVTEKTHNINQRVDELLDQLKATQKRAEEVELFAKRTAKGGAPGAGSVKSEHLAEFSAMNKGAEVSEEDYLARKQALRAFLRKGNEAGLVEKAMSVDSDPEGGYYVMPDTSGRVVSFLYETSPIRQFAAVQTITTDALEGFNDLDEADAGWVGERASRPETDTPDVGRYRIPVHEIYAEPRATQKLLDDAMIDIEGWLAGKVQNKFSRVENAAFVNGDGVEKPRGFLTYPAGVPGNTPATWQRIERVISGANGAFAAAPNSGDALVNLMFSLKAGYRAGSAWMMNRKTFAAVRLLKDSDGQYLWGTNLTESGLGLQLLGYPVAEAEDMPDFDSTGALAIAYGNFGVGYQIVDRAGIRVLRDPYTAKPYVKFYTTKRTGGAVINFEAIKLMEFSAS